MALSDKITTVEAFEAEDEVRPYVRLSASPDKERYTIGHSILFVSHSAAELSTHNKLGGTGSAVPKRLWWWLREYLRWQRSDGRYGKVLDMLWHDRAFNLYCPKPHAADPVSKIEVFMDPESAIAEKPMVTTIGRFLRKVCAVFSDEFIRDLDALHRADMSNEFEILTSVEDIRKAYLEGPSSCMSKYFHDPELCPSEFRPYCEGIHPVDSYAGVPGMGIAVARDSAGKINARCLVWQNPSDPDDKRAIRVYGDTALGRRLKRSGYKFRGLDGVKIRAMLLPTYSARRANDGHKYKYYAVPYIDAVDSGEGSGGASCRRLVKFAGEDMLSFINENKFAKLIKALEKNGFDLSTVSTSGSAGGLSTLTDIDKSALEIKCEVTGKTYQFDDPNLGETVIVINANGEAITAIDHPDLRTRFCKQLRTYIGGWRPCYAVEEAPSFQYQNTYYADNCNSREKLGFIRLDPEFYPEEQEWKQNPRYSSEFVGIASGNGRQRWIKKADSIQVATDIDGSVIVSCRHKKMLEDGGVFTKLHSRSRGDVIYADKSCTVLTTDTGRKVVIGIHDVKELWDGTVVFSRKAEMMQYLHSSYHFFVARDDKYRGSYWNWHPRFGGTHKLRQAVAKDAERQFMNGLADEWHWWFRNRTLSTPMEAFIAAAVFTAAGNVSARTEANGKVTFVPNSVSRRHCDVINPVEVLTALNKIAIEGHETVAGADDNPEFQRAVRSIVIELRELYREARANIKASNPYVYEIDGPSGRLRQDLELSKAIDDLLAVEVPPEPPSTSEETLKEIAKQTEETSETDKRKAIADALVADAWTPDLLVSPPVVIRPLGPQESEVTDLIDSLIN